MAGRGRAPKAQRRNASDKPLRGEWKPTADIGWQAGPVPEAPAGLMSASVEAWNVWLKAWFAAHWTTDDLPALRQLIRLYDQVERGEFQRASELRLTMDTYGITPKGQQDRRWTPPKAEETAPSQSQKPRPVGVQYEHLKVVGE